MWIHQQAWFNLGDLAKGWEGSYELKRKESGVYAFVIEGEVTIGDTTLHRRDGMGIWDTDKLDIKINTDSKLLLMEVPMQ